MTAVSIDSHAVANGTFAQILAGVDGSPEATEAAGKQPFSRHPADD